MSDYNSQQQAPIRATRDDDDLPPPPPGSGKAVPPSRRRGSPLGGFLILVLAALVLGCLWMIWEQSKAIDGLKQRFDELDTLIRSTDESLSESGTALQLKIRDQEKTLDKHWSEIKKLWGVSYDRNRKAIDENKATAEKAMTVANQAQSAIDQQKQQVNKAQQSLDKLQAEVESLATNVRNLSTSTLSASVQIEELESRLAGIDDVQAKLNGLSRRMADTEAAMKALDAYRSQVNQQLHQLRLKADAQP